MKFNLRPNLGNIDHGIVSRTVIILVILFLLCSVAIIYKYGFDYYLDIFENCLNLKGGRFVNKILPESECIILK